MNEVQPTVLINGKEVVLLVPDQNERELAVVDLNVIQRLSKYLSRSDFQDIKDSLVNKIQKVNDMDGLLEILEEDISFHRSVNVIKRYSKNNFNK